MTMQLIHGQRPIPLATEAPWLISPQPSSLELPVRDAFTALMWALSYPGRCYPLFMPARYRPGLRPAQQSCLFIGEALLDRETTFYTPDGALAHALAQTTARCDSAQTAIYHFYPELALPHTAQATFATVSTTQLDAFFAPVQSATLVIACTLGQGGRLLLSGPGIPGRSTLWVAGIPQSFWQLRAQTIRYPLGWDIFLVDGDQVVGLPRTTTLTYTGS